MNEEIQMAIKEFDEALLQRLDKKDYAMGNQQ
jgi:hypothetical protein